MKLKSIFFTNYFKFGSRFNSNEEMTLLKSVIFSCLKHLTFILGDKIGFKNRYIFQLSNLSNEILIGQKIMKMTSKYQDKFCQSL